MSKRTLFTTVTPLPDGITRETVLETLHNHLEMIDLNPLVTERHPIRPPPEADAEEFHAQWYSVTDKVNYLPGVYSGAVSFNCCFHDLPNGLQTHIRAPMGLDMKGRWTLGGTLPGEPRQPVEIGLGIPKTGLWLREDVNMKVNIVMTKFVKGTTKKTHAKLVQRLVEKAHLVEAEAHNQALNEQISLRESIPPDYYAGVSSPTQTPQPSHYFDGKPLNLPATTPPPPAPPVIANPSYSPAQSPDNAPHGHHPTSHSYFQTQNHPGPNAAYGHNGYPRPLNPHQNSAPYPPTTSQLNTNDFTAELPSQNSRTPIELDSQHR
ncbi:hypothetical protein ACLMJK_005238 [Lecanora helva]